MIRPVVRRIEPYVPGLTVAEVRARALGIDDVVKLGSNELAERPLPEAVAAASEATAASNRYPDPWCTALREALSERHGVGPEQIVPGNGADELIRLLAQATLEPAGTCVYAWPGFPTYRQGALAAGSQPLPVAIPSERLDLERLGAAVGPRTRLVCVANPNNPTGAHAGRRELEAFLAGLPPDVVCLLDEAYHGFEPPGRAVDGAALVAAGIPNLCVLRTFSKSHGLAGLRVGYAVASKEVADALNRLRVIFNVGSPAQAAALASLERQEAIDRRLDGVRTRREWLSRELAALGLAPLPSAGNFVFVEARRARRFAGGGLADALLERGVIVRDMGGFGAPGAIRITIGASGELSRLLAELSPLVSGTCE